MLVDRSGKPIATVAVCAYKSRKTIAACMESLVSQETDFTYEIVVVESSGDGSGDIIRSQFPQVQLHEWPHRLLLGAAKNAAAERGRGEFYLFIDSDCVAEPGWVDSMVKTFLSGEWGGVGGAVLNGNPETTVSVAAYLSEFSHFYPYGRERCVGYLCGANSAYRADAFDACAGFEAIEPLYVDLILGKKMKDASHELLFNPQIRVRHWHRDNMEEHAAHQISRGRAAAVARRKGALIGEALAKYPALAFLGLPVLFGRKAVVFPARYARTFPGDIVSLIRSMPSFWLGMMYWHYGFLRELVKPTQVELRQESSPNA